MKTLIMIIALLVASISNAATFTSRSYNIDQETLVITFSVVPAIDTNNGVIEYTTGSQEPATIKFSKPGLRSAIIETNKDCGSKIIFDPSTGWLTVITCTVER